MSDMDLPEVWARSLDGLSEMGLPTPNLFTGGHEFHSVREWASLQEMSAAAAVIVHLAAEWAPAASEAA